MATKTVSLRYAATTFRNIPLEIKFKFCIATAEQNVQDLRDLYDGYIIGRVAKNKKQISEQIEFKKIFG